MAASLLICGITCVTMIASILFFPKIRIKGHEINTYWIITLAGAAAILLTHTADISEVKNALTADTAINPLKILVLFISMTVLSIFLDEVGFFSYLAAVTLEKAGRSQFTLFMYLYGIVSILTVFTSNDIIILTFTPFICYFAKNASISPMPYLFAEFIAANTWSMALIIGNPTNIYLATANGIGFLDYFVKMILPTVTAGIVSFTVLFLIFKKQLSQPIVPTKAKAEIKDKLLLYVGIIHLGLCTVLLAVSSYIRIEMYYVSLGFAVSLAVCVLIISVARKRKPVELIECLKRSPWALIPFVLSMFVLILSLSENGVTQKIDDIISKGDEVFSFGVTSFASANIINNIPMSVLFSSIAEPLTGAAKTRAIYASVVGSNIGAFLTPVGALAGIMWSSILRFQKVKFGFGDFVKYGAAVSLPTILATLTVLDIEL